MKSHAGIVPWSSIASDFKDAIIIGNGASTAIHKHFRYESLWEAAISDGLINRELVSLANQLNTGSSFELLLRQLWTAETVDKLFDIDAAEIAKAYEKLQEALIKTVRKIHCPHATKFLPIQTASVFLRHFKTVFSLNYDLLTYWAMMTSNTEQTEHQFKDCFINGAFAEDWENFREPIGQQKNCTLVFYPHGALQFVQTKEGIDKKLDCINSTDVLLETVLQEWEDKTLLPLFVSEGDSNKKMRSIQRSTYLSRVYYEALPESGRTLVIYGWSMDEDVDGHLLKQLGRNKYDKIAVSVHAPTTDDVAKYMTLTKAKLSDYGVCDVVFFDSESKGCWIH